MIKKAICDRCAMEQGIYSHINALVQEENLRQRTIHNIPPGKYFIFEDPSGRDILDVLRQQLIEANEENCLVIYDEDDDQNITLCKKHLQEEVDKL